MMSCRRKRKSFTANRSPVETIDCRRGALPPIPGEGALPGTQTFFLAISLFRRLEPSDIANRRINVPRTIARGVHLSLMRVRSPAVPSPCVIQSKSLGSLMHYRVPLAGRDHRWPESRIDPRYHMDNALSALRRTRRAISPVNASKGEGCYQYPASFTEMVADFSHNFRVVKQR